MGGWRTRGRTTSTRCTSRSAPPRTAQRRSRSTSAGPTPRSPTRPTGSPPRADAPVQLSGGGPPRATPLPARGQLLNSWEAHPSTCATAFIYTHACRNVFFLINSRSADRGRYVLHCSTQQLVSRSILLLNLIPSSLSSSGAYYGVRVFLPFSPFCCLLCELLILDVIFFLPKVSKRIAE
jgi:hypothetical protein